ncbi:MAG: hypothetical protein KKE05_00290 [Nanoarchaeota archaeon]|nr:hypothetical protein [Nanoarchaeota archaeon]
MYIWVVEVKSKGEWVPIGRYRMTKEEGLKKVREWKQDDPFYPYRLTKYIPAPIDDRLVGIKGG